MTWNGRAIITCFDYPPIPNRNFDYSAWIDGTEDEGMTIGRGPTCGDAITDLIEQLMEAADLQEHI